MVQDYRKIFNARGTFIFSFSGFIARIPMAMTSLSIITMFAITGKSYSDAGFLTGCYVIVNAFVSPLIARMADNFGQARIARPATFISFLGLCSFLLGVRYDAPFFVLVIAIIFAGFAPSYGAFVRARWSNIYRHSPLFRTALAFETIVEEFIFMTAPILAVELTNRLFPSAGILASAFIMLTGGLIFTAQKSTEPKIYSKKNKKSTSIIRMAPIQLLTSILFFIGVLFGTAEIMAVAVANFQNQSHMAAVPLAFYALGSLIAGIVYGLLPLKMPLSKQLLCTFLIAAITTLPLLFVSNLWHLAFVLFFAGSAAAPTIIISFALIEAIAPVEKLTEGMTWANTGMFSGFAIGSAITGQIIDNFGLYNGFYMAIFAGFAGLGLAFIGNNYLNETSKAH